MINLFDFFDLTLGNRFFLFATTLASFILKAFTLCFLVSKTHKASKKSKFLVIIMLLSAMMVDMAWIIHLAKALFLPNFNNKIYIFFIRISWGFDALLYLALSLFSKILIKKTTRYTLLEKALCLIYGGFCFLFLIAAVLNFHLNTSHIERLISHAFKVSSVALLLGIIFLTLHEIKTTQLPRILKKQIKIFIGWIVAPFWLTEAFQLLPLNNATATNSYAAVNLSTLLLTFAFYFAIRKFIGLRFLNFRNHVEAKSRLNFIDGFKSLLERLSHATSIKELQHMTQMSFKDMFQVPISRTRLYVCTNANSPQEQMLDLSHIEDTVENFLQLQADTLKEYIRNNRILIYDEIDFSDFYEQSEQSQKILQFLDNINADVFIPIHTQQKVVAYIVLDRFARPQEFYSNVEHDEMAVFANYLGNIINLLQSRNLERLIQHEKELQEELYRKHQEVNQYKESIRSFLRNNNQKDIGILFYKNRHFVFGNQASKELINVNINQQHGHPITQALKKLARKVQEYKSPQSDFAKDKDGNKLVLSAVPHLEQNTVIITVYYPEISDLVKKQIELLKDPTKWDYLLYLETTQSGKLINQLIPGNGEQLLNFKINLLRAALSKKATLLEMPEADLLPTVKLLHHISLRENLHILKLTHQSTNNEIATKLFGINQIFGPNNTEKPLLEKLSDTGTLFIQNIHLLNLETQEYLAEYIMYGMYRVFKSDRRMSSNVRIICSTNKNLHLLMQEGTFSKQLYNQISSHTISMPSLLTITEHELHELAEGYTDQAIEADDFKNLLELTDKEKHKIAKQRPMSLQELKSKIQQLLVNKSKQHQIYDETQFDPAFETTDPDLIEAARLGKHALRDERIMMLLWDKFNSQSKIASFLGVNRSSVNRRCKQYNLE